jgi:hypothetical protein
MVIFLVARNHTKTFEGEDIRRPERSEPRVVWGTGLYEAIPQEEVGRRQKNAHKKPHRAVSPIVGNFRWTLLEPSYLSFSRTGAPARPWVAAPRSKKVFL